jgi:hypothetical protein
MLVTRMESVLADQLGCEWEIASALVKETKEE